MLFGYVLQLPSDIVYCSRGTVLTKLKLNKMSDSDADDSKIPPADECERRCQEFATVTGTDTALAMFYLQDRDWDLDVIFTLPYNLLIDVTTLIPDFKRHYKYKTFGNTVGNGEYAVENSN